ncbi:organic solute transporter Ostalpha-domain-containing protein [Hysterangium stoloniferum]|nr:organic solute transporter Ostalpha-domain-containing protein [Hysterangium stoloniferum]
MSTGNDTKRCFTQHAPEAGPPLIQNGQITFQAHHVGWIVASIFTILATVVSLWLISKHLSWYTKKRRQRYIVRLLLMVPIYAIVSLASYIFWNHALSITLLRDSYESFVLYSFFYLLLQYLSPTPEGQKEVFRKVKLDKWMFPLGFVRYRPEGLYFLQLMKWGVLQYCIIRPGTTVAAIILDYIGLYCEQSWSPAWGHIYITIIVSLSVTIAMYCLIQLYIPIAGQLKEHKPLLKLFAVKAVVFLTFWQATFLSILSMFGVVKDTPYMTADDINNGIAAILETFEMACFAFLHIWAFSYLPYRNVKADQTPRLRSLAHAIDIRDMWREIRDGSIYMGKTMRGVETDEEARRRLHFAKVMGRERCMDGLQRDSKENVAFLSQERRYSAHGHHRSKNMYLSESADRFGEDFQDEVEKELNNRNITFRE